MNDTKITVLERRVTVPEELVKKIIALPHLSNLAGRDSSNFVARFKMMIASDKLTDEERKKLEEEIAINERLESPALAAELHDSGATESPNAQEVRGE